MALISPYVERFILVFSNSAKVWAAWENLGFLKFSQGGGGSILTF
jgi:hypothetical protein